MQQTQNGGKVEREALTPAQDRSPLISLPAASISQARRTRRSGWHGTALHWPAQHGSLWTVMSAWTRPPSEGLSRPDGQQAQQVHAQMANMLINPKPVSRAISLGTMCAGSRSSLGITSMKATYRKVPAVHEAVCSTVHITCATQGGT